MILPLKLLNPTTPKSYLLIFRIRFSCPRHYFLTSHDHNKQVKKSPWKTWCLIPFITKVGHHDAFHTFSLPFFFFYWQVLLFQCQLAICITTTLLCCFNWEFCRNVQGDKTTSLHKKIKVSHGTLPSLSKMGAPDSTLCFKSIKDKILVDAVCSVCYVFKVSQWNALILKETKAKRVPCFQTNK